MEFYAVPQVRRFAEIMIPVSIGLALGLLMCELIWPGLGDHPLLRLVVMGGFVAAVLVLSVCYVCDRDKVRQATRGAFMTIFLASIALSVVYISLFVSEEVKRNILLTLALVFFAALPCWLYLQFVLGQRKTAWSEYVSNLFRLHVDEYRCLPEPPEHSCFHPLWQTLRTRDQFERDLYTEKFEGVFGPLATSAHPLIGALDFRTFLPVAVATVLISAGWLLVMWSPERGSTLSASGSSVSQPGETAASNVLNVKLDCFKFAFLGAYFFILQSLVRRYFQRDLKPDAYINAAVRIIIVTLLVWVLTYAVLPTASSDLSGSDGQPDFTGKNARAYLPILAFAIGVFPVIGWRFIESVIKVTFRWAIPTLHERFPLDELEGLNVWYESRLMEEGIENMENLATANLVDVMLNTRVPINRLVDWVDQSLLYLHLGEESDEARTKLRTLGVRTATDIVDLMESRQDIGDLARALNTKGDDGPAILKCIHATLRDEPNFFHIREWKSFPRTMLEESADEPVLAPISPPKPSVTMAAPVQTPTPTELDAGGALAGGIG